MPRLGDQKPSKKIFQKDQYCPPLLFVIYINDLLMKFEDTTLVSAYADDLAIACSGRSKIDMKKKLQKEDKIVKWSDDALLTLNIKIFKVSFFSLRTAEESWQPHITIRGLPFSFNAAPTFLGVQYDWQLTFSEHAKKVCQAMTPCPRMHNLGIATSRLENNLHRHSKISGRIWFTGLGSLVVKIQPGEARKCLAERS